MAERDSEGSSPEDSPDGFIFGVPVEQVTRSDGSVEVIGETFVAAKDEEAAKRLVREFADDIGVEGLGLGSVETSGDSRSTFGFSSDIWNSSWQPRGPKPNWRVEPPADPTLN